MEKTNISEIPVIEAEVKEQEHLIYHKGVEAGGEASSSVMKSKTFKLASMLSLIVVYFLAELIVGHITDSLTLVADSFHMLSDGLSLIVGLIAVRMSKRKAHESIVAWPSKREYYNTFGWVRFEVVGALINATFLLALCISILMEAIQKFYEPSLVKQPILVLAVGGGGLAINLIGLAMFGSHAHGGHDHGDSHGHSHNKSHGTHNHNVENEISLETTTIQPSSEGDKNKKIASDQQMNMQAVFLHVLGDALGSVIVMVSASIFIFVPHEKIVPALGVNNTVNSTGTTTTVAINEWIEYIDPVMSVLLVAIMVTTTVPLFKKSSLILLQTVPTNLNVNAIKKKIETIDGVQEVHDFHIWQLAGDKYVATVHIQCSNAETYVRIAKEMKEKLHDEDIHSLTIQPEFKKYPSQHCNMVCSANDCKTKVCCVINTRAEVKPSIGMSTDDVVTELNEIPKTNGKPEASQQQTVESAIDPEG